MSVKNRAEVVECLTIVAKAATKAVAALNDCAKHAQRAHFAGVNMVTGESFRRYKTLEVEAEVTYLRELHRIGEALADSSVVRGEILRALDRSF